MLAAIFLLSGTHVLGQRACRDQAKRKSGYDHSISISSQDSTGMPCMHIRSQDTLQKGMLCALLEDLAATMTRTIPNLQTTSRLQLRALSGMTTPESCPTPSFGTLMASTKCKLRHISSAACTRFLGSGTQNILCGRPIFATSVLMHLISLPFRVESPHVTAVLAQLQLHWRISAKRSQPNPTRLSLTNGKKFLSRGACVYAGILHALLFCSDFI